MKKFALLCLVPIFFFVSPVTLGAAEMTVEVGIELTKEGTASNSKTTDNPVQKTPLRLPQTSHENNYQLIIVGGVLTLLVGGLYRIWNREGRENA